MMHRSSLVLLACGLLACLGFAWAQESTGWTTPEVVPVANTENTTTASVVVQPPPPLISYKGGEVLTGNVSIRLVYLGYDANETAWHEPVYFIQNLANTSYYRTLTKYYKYVNGSNTTLEYASAALNLLPPWFIGNASAFASAYNITTNNTTEPVVVMQYIGAALDYFNTTPTPNELYILISRNGTILRPPCNTPYVEAGYASYFTYQNVSYKFAFVPEDYCMSFANVSANNTRSSFAPVGYNISKSPTGSGMIDSMLATLSQVIAEAVANPQYDGWYGATVNETIATVCQDYYLSPLSEGDLLVLNTTTNTTFNYTFQYTDVVGEYGYILPLIYDPEVNNATGLPWGCVRGVTANGTAIPAIVGQNVAWAYNTTIPAIPTSPVNTSSTSNTTLPVAPPLEALLSPPPVVVVQNTEVPPAVLTEISPSPPQ